MHLYMAKNQLHYALSLYMMHNYCAKDLCHRYNVLTKKHKTNKNNRISLLKKLLIEVGSMGLQLENN